MVGVSQGQPSLNANGNRSLQSWPVVAGVASVGENHIPGVDITATARMVPGFLNNLLLCGGNVIQRRVDRN